MVPRIPFGCSHATGPSAPRNDSDADKSGRRLLGAGDYTEGYGCDWRRGIPAPASIFELVSAFSSLALSLLTTSLLATVDTTNSQYRMDRERTGALKVAIEGAIHPDNDKEQIDGKDRSDSCCDDTDCKCDDTCLEQLARAICANDAGHIHDHQGTEAELQDHINIHSDCTTCFAESDDASRGSNADKKTSDSEQNAIESVTVISPATHFHEKGDACGHIGLRRRFTSRSDTVIDPSSLPSEACGLHLSFARKRYQDTLTAFGCICKAMLAHGLKSCCTTGHSHQARSSSRLSSSARSSLLSGRSRSPTVSSCCKSSCCSDGQANCARSIRPSLDKAATCGSECGTARCYEGKRFASASRVSVDSCCDRRRNPPRSLHVSEVDCDNKLSEIVGILGVSAAEKGLSGPKEHAVVAIRGMTCTGCENKVIRVLRGIPAVHNVKTSLVLCRAEFDLENGIISLQDLLQIVEKRTGFSVEAISAGPTRELRFAMEHTLIDAFVAMIMPEGVEFTGRVDKGSAVVAYNPRVTGARKIMDHYKAFSPSLAPEPSDPALVAGIKHIRTLALRTITSATLTVPVLIMAWAPLPQHPREYAIASFTLATIVQILITGPVYLSAFKSLFFSGLVETDLLIVLSTTTAYVYSVVAFAFEMNDHPLSVGEFFETSTLLVTLIMLGQLVSAVARQRAIEAISIRSLQQNTATLIHSDDRKEDVDIRLLQYGDVFEVLPDSPIVTDGTVQSGQSEVDEAMMTGESRPVIKAPGSKVIAGTVNGPSTLMVEVDRLPGENTISDIAEMVDDARFSRAKVQATVDKVCGWFVPIVLTIAIVTFVAWLAVGLAVRKQSGSEAAIVALTYAIAVLAICCPCAIGLAVPMVILVAGGVAAKVGLVFKAATTIESARNVSHVVFDKTGTLTQGHLVVISSDIHNLPDVDVHSAIYDLVKSSRHPVARAVADHLTSVEKAAGTTQVSDVKMMTGQGIQGTIADRIIRGGSARWIEVENHPMVQPLLSKGLTTFCVAFGDQLLAVFGLGDALRPESLFVVDNLKKRGIAVSIFSGDHPAAVETIAVALGIPMENAKAACMPADKQRYIKELATRNEVVLFCGDGANDAIALAQADIGVHLHTGEGAGFAASTAADVVLTHPSLMGILTLLELSEAVSRRILLNFAWSAIYNLVAILFAAGAFVHARIAPAYAGLGEIVSVVPVVLVALQLKWFKPQL
ncbi:uncharacterized protein FIBRA_04716 [Fibroporia radiculosa]|uniref:HMA domain-containing protein n=1 Tax=Fibroporia radiculosa TaxID=599839 RepID=J4G7U4_9APHY|nr:uncharacterized protein FIBRA_04716 [Fibroporia radiculosa]CCM02613.1 predicted protein [Fibroporia radiculosa]